MSVGTQRRIRHKIFEWLRRYAPNEIAGWVGQLGAAAAAYALTGSYAAAVIAATIGASAGYYAAAYFNAVRWSYRTQAGRSWPTRVLANGNSRATSRRRLSSPAVAPSRCGLRRLPGDHALTAAPGAASADADAPCDEDCNRAAARLQRRGPILSAVTTDRRKTMTTITSMKRFGYA